MIVFLRYPFGSVRTGLRAVLEKLYCPASLQSQRSCSCRRARSTEIEISPNLTPIYHSNFWTLLFLPWFQSLSEKKKKDVETACSLLYRHWMPLHFTQGARNKLFSACLLHLVLLANLQTSSNPRSLSNCIRRWRIKLSHVMTGSRGSDKRKHPLDHCTPSCSRNFCGLKFDVKFHGLQHCVFVFAYCFWFFVFFFKQNRFSKQAAQSFL